MAASTPNQDDMNQRQGALGPTANSQAHLIHQLAEAYMPNDPANPMIRVQDGRPNVQNLQNNNHFGVMRDRLFHALLVKMALGYHRKVNQTGRRIIECLSLLAAIFSLVTLLFVHLMFSRSSTTCLESIKDNWPKDGVLRVEVIRNLEILEAKEKWIDEMQEWQKSQHIEARSCDFNPAHVFLYGPDVMPAEIRALGYRTRSPRNETQAVIREDSHHLEDSLLSYFIRPYPEVLEEARAEIEIEDEDQDGLAADQWLAMLEEEYDKKIDPENRPGYVYVAEYSLLYGLLRLPPSYRTKHSIPQLTVRINAESTCFGDPTSRSLMLWTVGYEESIISSLRQLAKNEKDTGYLHDLRTNEHYHFVTLVTGKQSYAIAFIILIIFTFAISMLLRFSHHQIFLFIVDLLHMFEVNQTVVFPAAPLLTVILALVGMEAIMSEVFSDTSTAFYVILIVWVADQFDAICCHSPISKRYWLRFFYLYQFFFYAYQYRFGGQHGTLALMTTTAFTLHSMIFFLHHYEIPLILYQDGLQRILSDVQHNPPPEIPNPDGTSGTGGSQNGRPPRLILHLHQLSLIRSNSPNSQQMATTSQQNLIRNEEQASSPDDSRGGEPMETDNILPETSIIRNQSQSIETDDYYEELVSVSNRVADELVNNALRDVVEGS